MSPTQQVINFNNPTGKIIVNEGHRAEQSKDVVKPVRFEPDVADRLKNLCFENNITFSDFIRTASDFAELYFELIKPMMDPEVKEIIVPVIKAIAKKF